MDNFNAFDDFNIDPELTEDTIKKSGVSGHWQRIFIEPNPITGERYNVGVLFNNNGNTSFKLIEDTNRLKCLFNQQAVHNTMFALKHIRAILEQQNNTKVLPDIFMLSEPMPAAGESVDEILNELFFDIVPLGRPPKQAADKAVKAKLPKKDLVKQVHTHLKKTFGTEANLYIPQKQAFTVDDQGHTVDIPLIGQNQAADLISATYSRAYDIERVINQSVVDLNAVRAYKKRFEQSGLFILRPSTDLGFTIKEVNKAGKLIESLFWKFQKDFYIEVEDQPKALAEASAHWFTKNQA
nr:hypothetical protein 12 [Piscirickettsiaceae bacterium]